MGGNDIAFALVFQVGLLPDKTSVTQPSLRYLSSSFNNRSVDEPTDTTWQSSSSSDADDAHADLQEEPTNEADGVKDTMREPEEDPTKSNSKQPEAISATKEETESASRTEEPNRMEKSSSSFNSFEFRSNIPTPAQVRHLIEGPNVAEASLDKIDVKPEQTSAPQRPKAHPGNNQTIAKYSPGILKQSKIPVPSSKKDQTVQRLEPVSEDTSISDETAPTSKRLSVYDNVTSNSFSTSDTPKAPLSEILDSAEAKKRFVSSAAVNKLLAEYETPKAKPVETDLNVQQVEGRKRPNLSRGWTVDDEELNEMIRASKMRKADAEAAAKAAQKTTKVSDKVPESKLLEKPPIAPRKPPLPPTQKQTSTASTSKSVIPVVIPQKQVITKEDLIQEPEDELMAAATSQPVQQVGSRPIERSDSRAHRQQRPLCRRESTFSFGDDNNSDSDSSFASAAASRQRLVTRFGRRIVTKVEPVRNETNTTGSRPADDNNNNNHSGKQQVSRRRAGPVGGSLVKRMARNFDQVVAQQKDNLPHKVAGKSQQRVESVDEEVSQRSDATWYDAKSMEMLDEQDFAELLAEFEDEGADEGRAKPGTSRLQPAPQVEPLTPSDVSQLDQFFSAVDDEQPFVSVAESTLDDDRAKRDRTDAGENDDELEADDDTLNDGDDVDEESIRADDEDEDDEEDDIDYDGRTAGADAHVRPYRTS